MTPTPIREPSRTAVFVCQGRAVADGRLVVGRFADPVAGRLLRPGELEAVERARADDLPADWRERLAVETLRACAETLVPRTIAIDDAIREAGHGQVVILGAGLDSRPWRLAGLREAVVFSVDHRASQADARERSAGLRPLVRRLELVPVELGRDDLGGALAQGGHDRSAPTTWVLEGVVPYLAARELDGTLASVAGRSSAGSVLVVNYQARALVSRLGRRAAGLAARVLRLDDPLAGEPWRSTWAPGTFAGLLARHGFRVRRDEDLLAIGSRLGSPAAHRRTLGTGRVAVADRRADAAP